MSAAIPVVELITIGREILDGRVVDTNAVKMAEELRKIGLIPRWGQRVDDSKDRIVEGFRIARARSQIVLVTGGLGPTSDDLTAEAFGAFLGEGVVLHAEAYRLLESTLSRIKRPMNEPQKKQAMIPPSCIALPNPEGTAPGFGWIQDGQAYWFFMPGVPREMIRMLREQVVPKLPQRPGYRTRTWVTQFTAESLLQEKLTPLERKLPPGFEITYRTKFPENHIGLCADCTGPEDERKLNELACEMDQLLEGTYYTKSDGSEPVKSLEEVVSEKLRNRGERFVTVESCTSGMIADRITALAGSSEVYWGGFVVYDNEAKCRLDPKLAPLIEKHGAVSEQVAMALAEAGSKAAGGAWALSTTGIAGPGGGSETKPVGLCYIGLAKASRETQVLRVDPRAGFDRARNRGWFTQHALDLLLRSIQD